MRTAIAFTTVLSVIILGSVFFDGFTTSPSAQWSLARRERRIDRFQSDPLRPSGIPLRPPEGRKTVVTQGYGIGTHSPAELQGAVDLAVDANGDGVADPAATWGVPVIATHPGKVVVTPMSWPGGNHIWVINERYRTGYAHLDQFAVRDGDVVERGDVIGYVGSSGFSTGPHLDYQVWVWQGRWVNVSPFEYGIP